MTRTQILLILILTVLVSSASALAQCPSIAVIGPAGVTSPGDEMVFRAEVADTGTRPEYLWTVSSGVIVKGQGTAMINVGTDRSMGGWNVKATVKISGLQPQCENTASTSAPVWIGNLDPHPGDEWSKLSEEDERGRLDAFFAELSNNPANTGYIVFKVTSKERFDPKNKRLRSVIKHVLYRNFDRGRLVFVLERGDKQRTTLWRIPEGGIEPPCNDCLKIKGGDL